MSPRRRILLTGVAAAVLTAACGAVPASVRPPGTTSTPARSSAAPGTTTPTSPPTTAEGPAAPVEVGRACVTPPGSWPVADRLQQLLMVSGEFSSLAASAPEAAAGVGGLVLFGQPAAGSGPAITSGIASLVAGAASAGVVTPWMSTDEEGGEVARLADVIGALPTPRQMAAEWSTAQLQSTIEAHARAMRALGVTMDLAPVVDTASPTDTVADEDDRSFSEDPSVAAAYGLAFAHGLQAGGIVPVLKHFPGLGHADADTDDGPATDPPLSQLEGADLIPFEQGIAAGLPVVMVSHAMVPGLTDGLPASLSPATYAFLRGQLGFVGVAMTDSLGAGAVSATGDAEATAAVTAIEAGADMAMIDAADWPSTVAALQQAVDSGTLPLAQVDTSVGRILTAKGLDVCGGS